MSNTRDKSRLAHLLRGLLARRSHPNIESLAREPDPHRFVWRILPHAARSFAVSIVVLPHDKALGAAVAYLYCRMLDTYEDLFPGAERAGRLLSFSSRFDDHPMPRPDPIPPTLAVDDRDRLHLLLVHRCTRVDAVFDSLSADMKSAIVDLVQAMAEGMAWSVEILERQGGAFLDERQVARYCHHVMGNPIVFALRLAQDRQLSSLQRRDAMEASEMIQLANITRDIERDLGRGIAYHPALRPYLGETPAPSPEARDVVRQVREELLIRALTRVSAYRRMVSGMGARKSPGVRAGALTMLLFTDLYFRSCAVRAGHDAWTGPRGQLECVLSALPAGLSHRWAERRIERVERRFLEAAERLKRQFDAPDIA